MASARRRGVGTPAAAALSVVNNATVGSESSSTVSPLASPAFNATTGNLVVAIIFYFAGSVSAVTDTAGNSYSSVSGASLATGNKKMAVYVAASITGNASNVVSVTNTCTFASLHVYEVHGAATVTPVDATATGTSGSGTGSALASASFSTTVAQELLIMGASCDSSSTVSGLQIGGQNVTLGTFVKSDGTHTETQTGYMALTSTVSSVTATANVNPAAHWGVAVVGVHA